MSRRASLPGADELFRKTSDRPRETRPSSETSTQDAKSTKLQVATSPSEASAEAAPAPAKPKAPKHEEKITFYCTADDLMAIERTRLELRAGYGVSADRGRIVRAALAYVLEDFAARGEDSVLLRKLND